MIVATARISRDARIDILSFCPSTARKPYPGALLKLQLPAHGLPMTIDDADRKTVAQAVRSYIAKERISREEFAQRTKLGKSTVDKLVIGIFSEKTVLQIESQLNVNLRRAGASMEFAAEEFGRYTREEADRYTGDYVFARPSFREDANIHAFHMQVQWDRAVRALLIRECANDKKLLQFGHLYIPRASRHIFILSNEGGWVKSVILSELDASKRMKGVMLTVGRAFANIYAPMAMPVIMNKYDKIDEHMIGTLSPGTRLYEEYKQDLSTVEQDQYAKWIPVRGSR
jgi:hypothetical protein